MHNLRMLADEALLKDTDHLVREERKLLTEILRHLREIERRRLYCGHTSLFGYATKRLGYSEDQACRRISAMRLVREMPELERDIASGELTLSHINVAQSLFSREKRQGRAFSPEKKAKFSRRSRDKLFVKQRNQRSHLRLSCRQSAMK